MMHKLRNIYTQSIFMGFGGAKFKGRPHSSYATGYFAV